MLLNLRTTGSLGEDLENIIIEMWLVLNDDNYGTQYLSSLPYPGKFYRG